MRLAECHVRLVPICSLCEPQRRPSVCPFPRNWIHVMQSQKTSGVIFDDEYGRWTEEGQPERLPKPGKCWKRMRRAKCNSFNGVLEHQFVSRKAAKAQRSEAWENLAALRLGVRRFVGLHRGRFGTSSSTTSAH